MTEPLFFDTDCVSAFLWIGSENLLAKLYPGRIVIPQSVYNELSVPGVSHLKRRIDSLIQSGDASIMQLTIGSEEYAMYRRLTASPEPGHKIIGRGEAASIVLAKYYNGILASNNLRDISDYVIEFDIKHITTGDILFEAYQAGLIDEQQGNTLWMNMLARRRKLGYGSFTEYLHINMDKK